MCPLLLERVRINPEHAVHLTSHLVAERVLAMMLGVHDSHINDCHKSSLLCYDRWKKFFVKDRDETFVGELLGAAVGILGTTPPSVLKSDKTAFSVHPKKVKLVNNYDIYIYERLPKYLNKSFFIHFFSKIERNYLLQLTFDYNCLFRIFLQACKPLMLHLNLFL